MFLITSSFDRIYNHKKMSSFSSEKPINGFVSDYVYLIRGLLDRYEASLREEWLVWACQLQDKLDELFWDSNGGGYYEVTNEDPSILLRLKEGKGITGVFILPYIYHFLLILMYLLYKNMRVFLY